jgi:glycosyltransferase involved in cell wall biosynthesis
MKMVKEENLAEVSVVMCTYNGGKFLVKQLESILDQTYSNLTEVICVDDGSTDDTLFILKDYAENDSRIKIFINESNLGYIKNYEKAFTLATKPYIAIADQDDIWFPNKISLLMAAIENNLMVYSDNLYIDSEDNSTGRQFSHCRYLRECTSCLNFIMTNGISGHTALINRELLKYALPFNKDIPYDYWLAFHAVQYGKIPYVNEPLVGYRQHDNNVIGALGLTKKEKKERKLRQNESTSGIDISENYNRVILFANAVNDNLKLEKQVLMELSETYHNLTFKTRLKRVKLFWKNKDQLIFFKKRNQLRKAFFCLKMFWKIK